MMDEKERITILKNLIPVPQEISFDDKDDYILEENMTFQVDTFISAPTFGTRWEKGVVITKDGCKSMTNILEKGLIELDF